MLTPLDLNFFVLLGPRPGTLTQTRYVDSTREITTTDTNLTLISWRGMISHGSVIIKMHIYYVFINTLSAHMVQINLDTLFYMHVEHSPTKTIYVKYYIYGNAHTHTHINCNEIKRMTFIWMCKCARACTHTHAHTHTHTKTAINSNTFDIYLAA